MEVGDGVADDVVEVAVVQARTDVRSPVVRCLEFVGRVRVAGTPVTRRFE